MKIQSRLDFQLGTVYNWQDSRGGAKKKGRLSRGNIPGSLSKAKSFRGFDRSEKADEAGGGEGGPSQRSRKRKMSRQVIIGKGQRKGVGRQGKQHDQRNSGRD